MYYVIETNYIGPNGWHEPYTDANKVEISTAPARTNGGAGEICISGWCGTVDNFEVCAHGEHATLEGARSAVYSCFAYLRDKDPHGEPYPPSEPHIVETYRLGKYHPMGADESAAWGREYISANIAADTTDERINEMADELETLANQEGYTLRGIRPLMTAWRNILKGREE